MRQLSSLALFLMSLSLTVSSRQARPDEAARAAPVRNDSDALSLPDKQWPVRVQATFLLHDINEINDEDETFTFAGVLTLKWRDERQAFDPAVAGVRQRVYQGDYQFNEISPSWFPQEVLVNESGKYEKHAVLLKIEPDGTSTLVQTVSATAKTELDMRRFPFDTHRLEAVFELLGFDTEEVVFEATTATRVSRDRVRLPQWNVVAVATSTRDDATPYAGRNGVASAFVVTVSVKRESFYIVRLVVLPLVIIVLLSFSVFWMDRSSLGDRINVSFIGILTGVAYQIVMADILPRISYFTLIHGFLNISFFAMCATVVINLLVGALDKKGNREAGDRLDRRCRWVFPLSYFGLVLLAIGAAFLFY